MKPQMKQGLLSLLAVYVLLGACSSRVSPGIQKGAQAMEIQVTSAAFKEGESIPEVYTCDGQNIPPPLAWSGIPKEAKALALICDDPDAPIGVYVHWVLYNLPATVKELPAGVPKEAKPSPGGVQGANGSRQTGYTGPCPPSGTHRYYFKLYALGSELALKPGASAQDLQKAMEGHILAQGQLMGRYKRK
jgi:Raf kinase inhibitor-like YbhB/YbcL family protein